MIFSLFERNDSRVDQKEKVYITGHSKDSKMIHRLAEIMMNEFNCKVWICADEYNITGSDIIDTDRESLIYGMDMVVFVISEDFLTDTECPAASIEFKNAEAGNRRILPLLMHRSLATEFSRAFGSYHALDLSSPDFENRLKNYWNDIINTYYMIGMGGSSYGEWLNTNAFAGKAFVSYRKKDRELLMEFLRTFHAIDECRDIGLWYDDFLIAGEEFNEQIQSKLESSDVVILIVTPSLLEPGNYVMNTEYPLADGKLIVPVLMSDVDSSELELHYPNIGKPIDIRDKEAFVSSMKNMHRVMNDGKTVIGPEEKYLIGMAYLEGKETERNRSLAIELLSESANEGNEFAMYRLGQMFLIGDCVPVDKNKAEKLLHDSSVIMYQKAQKFSKETDADNKAKRTAVINSLGKSLNMLADMMIEKGDTARAKEYLTHMLKVSNIYEANGIKSFFISRGSIFVKLGEISLQEGNEKDALKFFNEAETDIRFWSETPDNEIALYMLAVILMKRGIIGFEMMSKSTYDGSEFSSISMQSVCNDLSEALTLFVKMSNGYMRFIEEIAEIADHLSASALAIEPVDIYAARRCYEALRSVYRNLAEIYGDANFFSGYALNHFQLAVAGRKVPDKEMIYEAYSIYDELCKQYPDNKGFLENRDIILPFLSR